MPPDRENHPLNSGADGSTRPSSSRLIRERGLITYTSSECDSAAPGYLAGERLLSKPARWLPQASIGGAGPELQGHQRRIRAGHGGVQATRQLSASPVHGQRTPLVPGQRELLANRIVTAVVDPKHYGLSGIDPGRSSRWRPSC
jgi:hypothetical protein